MYLYTHQIIIVKLQLFIYNIDNNYILNYMQVPT